MKNKIFTKLLVASVLLAVVTSPIFATPTYKYLPKPEDLPKTFQEIQSSAIGTQKVESYEGDGVKSYTAEVFCPAQCCPGCNCTPGRKIGSLDFEYSPFKGDYGVGSKSMGGAIIRGGFGIAADLKICPNYTLGWLQYYEQTGYKNVKKIDGSPTYPVHPVTGITAPLVDIPYDAFSLGATKVKFESALICLDAVNKKICYIGSFFWGYENTVDPSNSVSGIYPYGWSAGLTQSFKDQFALEYAGWTLTEGCCIYVVPEPSSIILVVLGFGAIRKFRYSA